ncbi:MAG TPA: MFS transporter [Pseudogracilibacillus sp.]|nr:MFS transporter [Pseudogracilibacillus sp.]
MNKNVYILAVAAVTVGLVELIVGGVLPIIAEDMQVSTGTAGQLITIFALVYAISGPILLSVTGKYDRKKLFLTTLFIFFLGNIATYFSPTFAWMMIARVLTASSASLVIALSLTITPRIVEVAYRARAIGIIVMGISSSLVLGVPIGIVITNYFGWRMVFLGIAILTLITMVLVSKLIDSVPNEQIVPLRTQIKALGNIKIGGAHLATMFTLAGHYTFYAYFTPFLETTLHLSQNWISITYFIFGIAAVSGGALGGAMADKIGVQKTILIVIGSFAIALFILPYMTFSFPLFLIMMLVWGALSWALSPPQQEYIIQSDPETYAIHQSFNNSALQFGIALGSAIGGFVLQKTESVTTVAHVGSIVIIVAFVFALFSFSIRTESARSEV